MFAVRTEWLEVAVMMQNLWGNRVWDTDAINEAMLRLFQIISPKHPVVKCFHPTQSDDLLMMINNYEVSRRTKRITASNVSLMAKGQVSLASWLELRLWQGSISSESLGFLKPLMSYSLEKARDRFGKLWFASAPWTWCCWPSGQPLNLSKINSAVFHGKSACRGSSPNTRHVKTLESSRPLSMGSIQCLHHWIYACWATIFGSWISRFVILLQSSSSFSVTEISWMTSSS